MFCKSEQKEVGVLAKDPVVKGAVIVGGVLSADVSVRDLCEECNDELRHASAHAERGLKDVPQLADHLKHRLLPEVTKVERTELTEGFVTFKLGYKINCQCGNLEPYEGSMVTAAEYKTGESEAE